MKEISFRAATEKDRDFIRQVSARVFSLFGDYEEILTHWFLVPGVLTVIGSKNGQPAGFVMLQLGEKVKGEGAKGELLAIAVVPEHQGQGVGKALLGYGEDLAWQHRLSEIRLHTAEDNLSARYLFGKAGYKVVGSKKSYYPQGQSALMMVKMLDSLTRP